MYYVCGGFPSASGKTNLAMMHPPAALADRYEVHFFGDDIAWIYVDESDGRLYAFNPEYGVFGVAKDTNESSNPNAVYSIGEGSNTLFTNVAYNETMKDVWWEGRTKEPPTDVTGWRDWRGDLISDRPVERQRSGAAGDEWAHPNSRFTTTLANVPNLSPDSDNPKGVPIDAIIFGGRVRSVSHLSAPSWRARGRVRRSDTGRRSHIRRRGQGRRPALRPHVDAPLPFLPRRPIRRALAEHHRQARHQPAFAHVNWFKRDENGGYIWPGYTENLRALLWLRRLRRGQGRR